MPSDERSLPMRALPMLEPRRHALETCVFCPKLCRSACPVSNADTRETVTPWGKMSMAHFVATGAVESAAPFANPAWACTGCMACRDACDHKNDVADTLRDARAGLMGLGLAPQAALDVVKRADAREEEARNALATLAALKCVKKDARVAVLVGCGYARRDMDVARAAVSAVSKLLREPVSVVDACCGAPLLDAGDAKAFDARAKKFADATARRTTLVAIDAGCAATVIRRYADRGVKIVPRAETLIELAHRELGSISRLAESEHGGEIIRWHDPCSLGRELGIYEEPRDVLTKILGKRPEEFDRNRERAACSGAGGILPRTMPEVAHDIAKDRASEHESRGGGRVVTACSGSARSFRGAGLRVDDLATLIARALGVEADAHGDRQGAT